MGWDGMGWDGMGWDGMGWDGVNLSLNCYRVRSCLCLFCMGYRPKRSLKKFQAAGWQARASGGRMCRFLGGAGKSVSTGRGEPRTMAATIFYRAGRSCVASLKVFGVFCHAGWFAGGVVHGARAGAAAGRVICVRALPVGGRRQRAGRPGKRRADTRDRHPGAHQRCGGCTACNWPPTR
jgi:hypothetical protein